MPAASKTKINMSTREDRLPLLSLAFTAVKPFNHNIHEGRKRTLIAIIAIVPGVLILPFASPPGSRIL
jgi:hypothetical protein